MQGTQTVRPGGKVSRQAPVLDSGVTAVSNPKVRRLSVAWEACTRALRTLAVAANQDGRV